MIISNGSMDHVLAYDLPEVYLHANGTIPIATESINNTLNRQQQVSCVHTHSNGQ